MTDTPIRIHLENRVISAVLHDNPAANSLRKQLPLALDFRDYARQEVLAVLPEKLAMSGMPVGSDPEIGDIGYNHRDGVAVLHYSKIGYWPGTAILGHFDEDVTIFKGWSSSKPVRIELAD
ncbi:MAG: cyclophilin-like fold protein [Gulosibacter sp.]|uniref:cyclophilin-like fold protein n=1 Tax=Gulosibacter sp. TaxID=2817531 RepID=UPI003F90A6CD